MNAQVIASVRMMCRHPLVSVLVSYGGSSLAPDGQPLRGIFDDASVQGIGENNQFVSAKRQVLEIPTVDVPSIARDTDITIDSRAFYVRDFNPNDDGATLLVNVVPK